ncbi:MAG: ATP-binding cassette domain-containing protein [Parvularculaceae bacterium]|nr:ATP-binding cassette domain-containing protein [Parvularculaceae bacterium]
MTAPVLKLDNVVKRYGDFSAVDGLSFEVARGEIFGFLGPNGAGKTTTLRMMLDIIRPTSGRIEILGAGSAVEVRRRIGYLPEERGLYRKMRAADSIAYFAQLRGVPGREAKRKAAALLERFGLGAFARARNDQLSKGMAQKVQFLCAIAHDPELLILDEPFSGLDPINQHRLEDLVRELRAEGKTIIFSTHVMQHAERLCDRFLIMAKGKRRFVGDIRQARAAYPPKLILRTRDAAERLSRKEGVAAVVARGAPEGGEQAYELTLAPGADPQGVLKAAFDAGLRLSRFELAGASLHDIFVALAGDTAAAEAAPERAEAA